MFKVMMKEAFAILLALVLVAGTLFANIPIQASTSEGDESNDSGSNEGAGTGEEGGEAKEEAEEESEPEPEPEAAEPTEPVAPIEPLAPAVEEPEPLECDEGFVLNDEGTACIVDPDVSASSLPPECEGMTPLECLGEKVGAPPAECDGLTALQCLDLLNKEETPAPVESEPEPEIDPCLLDPGHESCPLPVDGECPEGYNMNEDEQCYPEHERCPAGYHSHEDDESGKCIPDSTPCDDGYIMNPEFPSCELEDRVCEEHPDIDECKNDNGNGNGNGDNGDKDKKIIIIKKIIKNVDIVKKIDKSNDDLDIKETLVAIDYDNGAGLNCVINEDDEGQCETFDVTKDKGKEPLLQVIPFD